MDNYTVTQVLTGLVEKSTLLCNSIAAVSTITQSTKSSISGFSNTYLTKKNPNGTGNLKIDTATFTDVISAAHFFDTTNNTIVSGTLNGSYLSSDMPNGTGTLTIDNIKVNNIISAKYFETSKDVITRTGDIDTCCSPFKFSLADTYILNITEASLEATDTVNISFSEKIPRGQTISIKFSFTDLAYFKPISFNGTEIINTPVNTFVCNFISYDGVVIDCLPVIKIVASLDTTSLN